MTSLAELTPNRIGYRFSARIDGRWEARWRVRTDRPTAEDARQLGYNINGLAKKGSKPCDAVKIVRVEQFDEEVVEL